MADPKPPLLTFLADDGRLHLVEGAAEAFRCGLPVSGVRVLTRGTIRGASCHVCYRS